mgnify:CR=1 FL=1
MPGGTDEPEDHLNGREMALFATSPVFMYPELLPLKPFQTEESRSSRIQFHPVEDV